MLSKASDEQERIAEAILALTGEELEPESVEPADLPAVLEGLEQATRGEFVSEQEIEAIWQRFGYRIDAQADEIQILAVQHTSQDSIYDDA